MLYRHISVGITLIWTFLLGALAIYSPKVQWVDCSENVPSPDTNLITSGVNFSALPPTLHCGRIVVPMDYSKPISGSNNITLGLAMYRPAKPKGLLFFSPGGTDPGAVAAWRVALNQTGPFLPDFSGLTEFDLMVMDIRGTWTSNRLNVSPEVFAPLLAPYPATQEEFDAFKKSSAAMIESFVKSSSPPGILQFTGTKEVVQDYDTIREALGYEKVHFLGLSYGSYRAALYATTFPSRVGRFVMDAVSPHGLSLFDQAQIDIKAANRALLRADAYCMNNASCPFHSKGRGIIPKIYSEILDAVDNSTSVTPWNIQTYMYGALSGQPVFPQLFDQLKGAVSGNISALGGGSSGTQGLLETVVAVPALCSDNKIDDNSFSAFQKSFKAASKIDTNSIGQSVSWQTELWCSAWPYASAPIKNISANATMLLVTADFDVDTATEKTTFAWTQMPNSALVVRHGDDHVSFNRKLPVSPTTDPNLTLTVPQSDATTLEKEFLRTGVLPCVRDETLVSVYHPGMQRGPIKDPYDVLTGYAAGDCAVAAECGLS